MYSTWIGVRTNAQLLVYTDRTWSHNNHISRDATNVAYEKQASIGPNHLMRSAWQQSNIVIGSFSQFRCFEHASSSMATVHYLSDRRGTYTRTVSTQRTFVGRRHNRYRCPQLLLIETHRQNLESESIARFRNNSTKGAMPDISGGYQWSHSLTIETAFTTDFSSTWTTEQFALPVWRMRFSRKIDETGVERSCERTLPIVSGRPKSGGGKRKHSLASEWEAMGCQWVHGPYYGMFTTGGGPCRQPPDTRWAYSGLNVTCWIWD